MKIIRNGEEVITKEILIGDVIICEGQEEVVKVCRDLAYEGKRYEQRRPMELTIV